MTIKNQLPVGGRGRVPYDDLNTRSEPQASAAYTDSGGVSDPSGELNPRRPQQYDDCSYSSDAGDSYVGAFGLF